MFSFLILENFYLLGPGRSGGTGAGHGGAGAGAEPERGARRHQARGFRGRSAPGPADCC